jgi:hypothetical protein
MTVAFSLMSHVFLRFSEALYRLCTLTKICQRQYVSLSITNFKTTTVNADITAYTSNSTPFYIKRISADRTQILTGCSTMPAGLTQHNTGVIQEHKKNTVAHLKCSWHNDK